MAIVTGTLGVNVAFLQEIKQENQDLKSLLGEGRSKLLDTPPQVGPRQAAVLLALLRDQVALHFALEEAYGYFEDATEVAPRLSAQADALRGEHGGLFMELCRLSDRAEELCYGAHSVRAMYEVAERFRAFDDRLRAHEARENELILQAFDDDIGVGD